MGIMSVLAAIVRYRRPLVVVLHLVAVIISNYMAFWLRFDGEIPSWAQQILYQTLPVLLLIRAATFVPFRLYEGLWRYTSIWDLRNLVASVATGTLIFYVLVTTLGITYPRSIYVIDSMLLVFFTGGGRLLRRVYRELAWSESRETILIYGAGDAGEMVVRDMRNNPYFGKHPVGFVDDDLKKVGSRIHGVSVLGTRADLPEIMERTHPDEILIAMPAADVRELRSVVRVLERFKVPIKTLPNLRDILDGKVEINEIRNLALEDLLPRIPIGFDDVPIRQFINGRRVMVTGAGGSIGSELCRQISAMAPAELILFERYENNLFAIDEELKSGRRVDLTPVVGDVSDRGSVRSVLDRYRPDVIFHAAAHKHVPLMEHRPNEAVKNNISGTRILAEESARSGVERFILISSDKAADPTSAMGASKRVAELIVQALSEAGETRFNAVRFGNVLGSNGSVVPLFLNQIRRGGPVTVTHKDVRRYFMLIPEAVQLVLHAATLGENGAIYALEMGEEFLVLDLARNLIRLSGYIPDEDIKIDFIGLRPGEKLSETLVGKGETLEAVNNGKIWRIRSDCRNEPEVVMADVKRIEEAAACRTRDELIACLSALVPSLPAGNGDLSRERSLIADMKRAGQ